MGAIFELDIPASEKLVLLAIADHARDDGTGCYASVDSLARKTSQSRRGVQKILRRVKQRILLVVTGHPKRGRATEYRIALENSERHSLFAAVKGRTSFAVLVPEGANLSAQKGEPGSPQPLRTVSQPLESEGANVVRPFLESNGILGPWRGYVDVCRAVNRPLTPYAIDLAIRDLVALKAQGNDPAEVLEQSIRTRSVKLWPVAKNGGANATDNRYRKPAGGAIAPPTGKYVGRPAHELTAKSL